jgi:hypothetical protein
MVLHSQNLDLVAPRMRTILTLLALAFLCYLYVSIGRVMTAQQNASFEVSDDLQKASIERHEAHAPDFEGSN